MWTQYGILRRGVATIYVRTHVRTSKIYKEYVILFIYFIVEFLAKRDLYVCKSFLLLLLLFYEKKTVWIFNYSF